MDINEFFTKNEINKIKNLNLDVEDEINRLKRFHCKGSNILLYSEFNEVMKINDFKHLQDSFIICIKLDDMINDIKGKCFSKEILNKNKKNIFKALDPYLNLYNPLYFAPKKKVSIKKIKNMCAKYVIDKQYINDNSDFHINHKIYTNFLKRRIYHIRSYLNQYQNTMIYNIFMKKIPKYDKYSYKATSTSFRSEMEEFVYHVIKRIYNESKRLIFFDTQVTFDDLTYKKNLFFDFFLVCKINNSFKCIAVETHGDQHYVDNHFYLNNDQKKHDCKKRDQKKIDFCYQKRYRFIEFNKNDYKQSYNKLKYIINHHFGVNLRKMNFVTIKKKR